MNTATKLAVPIPYVSENIRLDFFNNSNLKTDVQNRISKNIGAEFYKQLQDMKGDKGTGVSFSELTLLAMAYFYSEIFTDKIKDKYYSIEYVKGFLDGHNLTPYTAIHEIDVVFIKLNETPYFKHCWLIVQSAWFFNSEHFGRHQHIDYVNHFIKTGQKLPIENYKYDSIYLEKKYSEVTATKKKKELINGFTLVNYWYYEILFLVCKELQLPTSHFNILHKDNREYNPLTKSSRQLRPLSPFKVVECDIKSAFPTFLDCETKATLKDQIYNNLMLSKGILRSEAKILFNKVCNSGKYKTQEETILFFLECGYTKLQCDILINLTHHPDRIFYKFMTEYEATAISHFITQNNLQRGVRLHDALLYIDDKTKPTLLQVDPNCDFGYKELNHPVIKETFSSGTKRLPYAYINSIPKGLNLITKHEAKKPNVKGIANGFKFYIEKYDFISASFNLNNYFEIKDKDPKVFFYSQFDVMLSALHYLNKRYLRPSELFLTLIHIRQNSNYIFNVRALYSRLIKNHWNKVDFVIRERDYDVIELKTYVKNIDYLNDLNEARKLVTIDVNHYNLFALLQERIINNDFDFLDEALIKGKRNNNKLTYAIINKFNLLVTGRLRKKRLGVKKDPLYLLIIKRVLINSLSLKPQQQTASTIKGIQKYERDLKAFNRLINNRLIAQQLFLIVAELVGIEPEIIIVPNTDIINELKTEIHQNVNNVICENTRVGAKEFDLMFVKKRIHKIEPIELLNDNFDTDMSNSIFNQIDIAEAYSFGEKFFEDYQAFHGNDKVNDEVCYAPPVKEIYRHPEIDFD